eukprot:m.101672 g.101672  ORF g.101672 m.101672 type:complete len:261 (-) comp13751_c0_seq2:2373-3155(-)
MSKKGGGEEDVVVVPAGAKGATWEHLFGQLPDYETPIANNNYYDVVGAENMEEPLYMEIDNDPGESQDASEDPYKLPHGWTMGSSNDGRVIYIDHNTKTCHWLRPCSAPVPKEGDFIPLPPGWEFRPIPKIYYLDHNTRTTHNCDPRPVPENWSQLTTRQGVPYFLNHQKKTTQWHHPCSQPNPPPMKSEKAQSIQSSTAPDGKVYYLNHSTKETSWDNPLLRPMFFGENSQGLPPGWERIINSGKTYYWCHIYDKVFGL